MLDIDQATIDAVFASDDVEMQAMLHRALTHPYYAFEPRPDAPAEYDEQSAFVERNYSMVQRENGLWKYDYTSPERFKVCLGGTGSGKTQAGAFKVAAHVLELRPPKPRTPFWIIGETFPQVCQAGWVEKLSHLIPEDMIKDVSWYQSRRRWPHAVMLKHPDDENEVGWILEFKSYEQGIGAMKAVSIGGFWLNEECPYHLVGEIQGRCRDYDSPGWADFTPIECKDAEWPEAYEHPPEGWRFYHLNSLKNTALAEGFMERYLAGVPEDMRELRTIGKFTVLMGTVFQEFRKSIHVIESFRIPHDWKRFRGIDFGYNNPFCCLWAARDHDGRWYIYDEHYENQRLVSYHAGKIHEREWCDHDAHHGRTYSDHDAQTRAELAKLGIPCTLANKAINPSIEHIRSLMMIKGDGKPSFFIFNRCENLIREILGWKWPDGSLHRNPADTPEDKDNHCLVAGTLVTCERGQVPIEEVTTADKVLTRQGWKSVEWSGPTRFTETVLLTLEDGRTIEGTADHPVFEFDNTWVDMGSLTHGVMLCSFNGGSVSCQEKTLSQQPRESYFRECPTGDIQALSDLNCDDTLSANQGGDFTGQSTNQSEGQSQKGATSTTSTETLSTTQSPILNALAPGSMCATISMSDGQEMLLENVRLSECESETLTELRRSGEVIAEEKRKRQKLGENLGLDAAESKLPASNADASFLQEHPTVKCSFAVESVGLGLVDLSSSMTKNGIAANAALSFLLANIHAPQLAPVRVASVLHGKTKKQTYDLTISDAHEFFANGILVHNSIDAMRYVIYTENGLSKATKPEHRRLVRDTGRHGINLHRAAAR